MPTLTRGPVYKSDSDGEQPSFLSGNTGEDKAAYLRAMAGFRENARSQAIATGRLSPEIEQVSKYVQCLLNIGWHSPKKPKFKSRLSDNRLNNSRKNDLALLTDSRPTINVSSQIKAFAEQAQIAQDVIQYEWTNRDMDMELIRAVDIAKLNGTSFWKHSAAWPGMMTVKACGPDQVLPIHPGFGIQESSAVLYRVHQTTNYLVKKFPWVGPQIIKETPFNDGSYDAGKSSFNRPNHIPQTTWERLSPQMQRAAGVDTASSEMGDRGMMSALEKQEYWVDDPSVNESPYPVLIRNPYLSLKAHNYWYWVQPGQLLYPRKRLLVFAGRTLAYDGPSPFWHGKYPFSCLRLDPTPWSFWGMSKYRDLLPLNEAMNEIAAGIMDQVKVILNPTIVSSMGKVAQATWNAFYPGMPMAKLLLLGNTNPNTDVRYLEQPEIPAWILQFHQYLSQEFDRLSGAIDITNLGKKKQVPGADTVEQMRDSLNTTTRLEGRYIEKFLQDGGELGVSDMFQYYENKVLLRILGARGLTMESFNNLGPNLIPEGMPKEDHWRHFAMKIEAGSLLSNQKDRNKQMSISLATHNLLAVKTLHEALGLPPEAYKDWLEQQKQNIHIQGGGSRQGRGQRNGKAA